MPNKTILIADDEEQTCFCISMALKMEGYNTVVVNNGETALQTIVDSRCTKAPVDLLVCDIQMPKLNGEELIDKMNKLEITLPTIVITGFGEKDLVVRLLRKGCRDFIDKPFEPAVIGERIALIFSEENKKSLENQRVENMAKIGIHTRQYAHDINNILGGTMGYADLALTTLDPKHKSSAYIHKLMKTTSRAAEICENLLSATPCAGNEPVMTSTEINSLTERAAAVLMDVVADTIVVNVKTGSKPIWCRINAERIQQALLNLGINAAQAMPGGGKLTIECIEEEMDGCRSVTLTIADSGPGIPAELQSHLFDGGFSTKKNGKGIGLKTVREVIDEHSGVIRVASVAGKGTVFTIQLPCG